MHPELSMMVLRREHERRVQALAREEEIRQALNGEARSTGAGRVIAAGLGQAVRRVGVELARLNGRSQSDAEMRPGGAGGAASYRGGPAAA